MQCMKCKVGAAASHRAVLQLVLFYNKTLNLNSNKLSYVTHGETAATEFASFGSEVPLNDISSFH